MSNGTNAQDRPSLGDAHVALASLLSALKQPGTSTTSSPATTNHPASSPAQSSPAYQQPTPQTQPQPPPPPSSSNATTPVDSHHHHHAPRPPRPGGQAPTAVELSELGTYELLLQLGAHLGVVGPAQHHHGGQDQHQQPPQQPQGSGSQARQARPATVATQQLAVSERGAGMSSSSATSHGNTVYKPQPTRSGRMPRVPRPASSAPATAAANNPNANANALNDITEDANPTMSTLLFNDFFDFPSSEDEDDDPDFDPNAPASDFWGDLLARERADGDWTENEDGAMSGAGAGRGGMATRASGENGITSDEFAREIALLTSALNDPLPDLSAHHPHHPLPPSSASATATGIRTSPRRGRSSPATSAFEDSPAGLDAQTPPSPPQPPRKRRKTTTVPRRRAALSPDAENETNTTTTTTTTTSRRPDVLPAYGEPLASLSPEPEVRPPPSASASASIPGGARSAASGQQQPQRAVSPPLHTLYSLPVPPALNMPPPPTASTTVAVPPPVPALAPAAAPAPAPAPEKPARKPRRRMFTPEEAAQRRREQAAERMALKRKEDKEKQAAEAVRVKGIEAENAMLRERCRWLEEKCNDLERRLAAATASSQHRVGPGGASAYATTTGRPSSSSMDQQQGVTLLTPLVGESESDGGEYQVESSEESSSSDGGDRSDEDGDGNGNGDDDGQVHKEQDTGAGAGGDDDAAAAADDELTPLAARPSASTTTTTSSGQDPTVAGAGVNLDLASMGGPALSQLLTLVHAAAHAQGIPLPEGATTGM